MPWVVTSASSGPDAGELNGPAQLAAPPLPEVRPLQPNYDSLTGPRVVVVRDLPAPSPQHGEPIVIARRMPDLGVRTTGVNALPVPSVNAGGSVRPSMNLGVTTSGTSATGFDGLDNGDNFSVTGFGASPPDPQIAVGPDHVVEMVNNVGRVFAKNGVAVKTWDLATFFGVPTGYRHTDPKVIYDALSGRWFATYISSKDNLIAPDEGRLHIAVSQTSDPTGAWNVDALSYVDSLTDYPGIGLTNDKFTVSVNLFDIDGPPGLISAGCSLINGYCGEQTLVFQKSDLLAGNPLNFVFFDANLNRQTVRPAHSLSTVNDQYLTTWDTSVVDQLTVIRISGTPDAGNVIEASATNLTTLGQFDPPPSDTAGIGDCIVFGGSNLGPPPCIESGDYRMLEAIWRDNSLWSAASAECVPPGDVFIKSCAHLVEVETIGTPSVVQDFMYGAADEYFSWPAIRTDSSGNLFVSMTHTNASIFAEAVVAGRLASDPPNALSAPVLVRAGEVVHTSGRWGDYLGAAVDPVLPACVWVVGEYAKDTVGFNWGTYIAPFSFNDGCVPGTTPTATPTPTVAPTTTPTNTPTNTPTSTPTATPTPTPCPDSDGDTLCDSVDPDDDNDGCTDVQELGPDERFGGRRNPHNFWDFYDPTGDGAVALSDFFALLQRFGTTDDGGQAPVNRLSDPLTTPDPGPGNYHPLFDRGTVIGANPWNLGPPNGAIALTDFFALLVQFGHTCADTTTSFSVDVALADDFTVTPSVDTVAAGTVTFNVTNAGSLIHNLRVIRSDLAIDALPTDAGSVDEGAVDVRQSTANLSGGGTETVAVDLEAGSYVLICNVPGHYLAGMTVAFTVE